jgi:hypothetical protein
VIFLLELLIKNHIFGFIQSDGTFGKIRKKLNESEGIFKEKQNYSNSERERKSRII